MMNLYLTLIMFNITCFMFCYYFKNIILTLISMEFMMITLFMNLNLIFMFTSSNYYFLSIFLAISICEGVMGLSIMVYMIHLSGNDYSSNLNILKW